jgi:hypothetical protein
LGKEEGENKTCAYLSLDMMKNLAAALLSPSNQYQHDTRTPTQPLLLLDIALAPYL